MVKKAFLFICTLIVSARCCADYIEVTLLGTGTPRPSIERFGPATLVEVNGRYLMFDVGRGATIRLQQAGIPIAKIERIFFTHLHSDHISGLSDLWLTSWIWQRQKRLQLIGPKGIDGLAENLQRSYLSDFNYRSQYTGLGKETFPLESHEITQEGIVYQSGELKVSAFYVDHTPVSPAYGYRIDYGDRSVVISGDTTYSDNLIQHSQGVDLLVHEIAAAGKTLSQNNPRLNKVMAYHTTPEQMAKILKQTKPKLTVFNHVLLFGVSESTVLKKIEKQYRGRFQFGIDLMRIGVGSNTTTLPKK